MAYQKLEQKEAIEISEAKEVIGYLLGVKRVKRVDKDSFIYRLQGKATGDILELWGCGAIDSLLLSDGALVPNLKGCLFKFTYKGTKPIKGRPQPMKEVDIEYDIGDRIKL